MSALGQKRTFCGAIAMSALPPKADIPRCMEHAHFAPEAEIQDLFDHYISNGAQGWRHLKLECLDRRGTSVGDRITGTVALKLVVQSLYF